ncbi:uncharacterized protein LOC122733848 isoform X2 [Dromiciops gliroides]|uniref:uncharacterized protein LOC122733848 isoform X2 n=1 Tax=Dromiciops gliroides TaxID=33562 RepID=UPI001CC54A97|nr:uncharacterized protein LOC122733848 isoform X2 [Dromiciops gliroides]
MNRFPMYVRIFFLLLSMESLIHTSFVDSDKDEKTIELQNQFVPTTINPGHVHGKSDADKEQMDKSIQNSLPKKELHLQGAPVYKKTFLGKKYGNNSEGHTLLEKGAYWKNVNINIEKEETYTEPNEYAKDHSLKKKGINWDGEVMSLGCISFLFALTGGAALWLTIYTHMKREETRELDNLAEKLVPLQPLTEAAKWEPKESFPVTRGKERRSKTLLHSVLKTERKKKRCRKRRRPDSRLELTRRGEIFTQKKRNETLGIKTQDIKLRKLSEQIVELQKKFEKEKRGKEEMQDAKRENQVQLSPNLPDYIPTNTPTFQISNFQ